MGDLEIIIRFAITCSIFFALGNNLAHYNSAKEWLDSHGIDYNFYEDKKKVRKNDSLHNLIDYYLGWAGRHIAYKLHSKR